jgi:hypothetical protein
VTAIFDNAIKNIERFLFIIAAHQAGKRAARVEYRAGKRRLLLIAY